MEIKAERKSNVLPWQIGIFEGFDKDIMVMQRDEEEVFDGAIHVFFDKDYYDAYIAKAVKYSTHGYAYHVDKLGEVINQIFEEGIQGLVINMNTSSGEGMPAAQLCDEKYISAQDLLGYKDIARGYHLLYTAHIERCAKEEAIAGIWTKYVYIIGSLPDKKPAPGQRQTFELMTMKRKIDNSDATAEDFDYESLKVFLSAESAMRYNPEKKPVNKYKLSMLSQLVKGRLRVIIEPHRSYWLEYDPADFDVYAHGRIVNLAATQHAPGATSRESEFPRSITKYLDLPKYNEAMAVARIKRYAKMKQIYILLNPISSDYRVSQGSPFLMKQDEKNIMLYLFEKYADAQDYVLQNQNLLPILDSTFPIGVIFGEEKLYQLETVIALAGKIGVTAVALDADTSHAIACDIGYFKKAAGYSKPVEALLGKDDLEKVTRGEDKEKKYRLPIMPFYDARNEYMLNDEIKARLASYIDNGIDKCPSYMASLNVPEIMTVMNEAAKRFDKARKENDKDGMEKYGLMMNRITIPLVESLCEKPYIFTLKKEDGDFALINSLPYLVVTNRFEAGRRGEAKLMPAGLDNPAFMEKLCEKSSAAVLTDGPNIACVVNTRLMNEAVSQWKKVQTLRAELLIYMTQGCGIGYEDALCRYKKLKSDNDIFVEFASAVRNGGYPPRAMLEVGGYNAKTLADERGCNMLEAYEEILSLKELAQN